MSAPNYISVCGIGRESAREVAGTAAYIEQRLTCVWHKQRSEQPILLFPNPCASLRRIPGLVLFRLHNVL